MNYYLVDFENVHEGGLDGLFELEECDYVCIFYTANNSKTSLDFTLEIVKRGLKCSLCGYKVQKGKEALDKLMLTHLGFLIGKNECGGFFIISNDKGYDNAINYCKEHYNATEVKRFSSLSNAKGSIKSTAPEQKNTSIDAEAEFSANKDEDAKQSSSEAEEAVFESDIKAAPLKLPESSSEIKYGEIAKILQENDVDNAKINVILEIVHSNENEPKNKVKQAIYQALRVKYRTKEGQRLYSMFKKLI